jgi:hypothetical protein
MLFTVVLKFVGQRQHRQCFMRLGVFIATLYPLLYNCMMHKIQKQLLNCSLDICPAGLTIWHVKNGAAGGGPFFNFQ